MTYKRIALGVCEANCFIVTDDENNACIFDIPDNGEGLWDYLESSGVTPKAVVITHAHIDHIYGLNDFMERAKECGSDVVVYIHEEDAPAMTDPVRNLSKMIVREEFEYTGTLKTVVDGDEIRVGEMCFKVISTPGHTPGSACYYLENENQLFSGDTLFSLSIGRVDFPGGNPEDMRKSLQKLFELPGDCKVHPGHYGDTTIARERTENIFAR